MPNIPTADQAAPPQVDPADFIAELHAEGEFPVTAGGDPAVPDSLGTDPAAWAAEYIGHAARLIGTQPLQAE
ncbi:hypothetical protein [Actinomadura rupiterrae]|uniref:hypothetical protein n=1 Tax=Actinomadura rupiterrae TaxID=559627 RepID=UPI0020A51FD9|nr:hypothetical protein [Actinomadura rupiterrae]MCP2342053.1 hypothetical protein [Actinomadura rupiterrae]